MHKDVGEIFFTEEAIAKRVVELGRQISSDYAGKSVLLVGVLKGSFVFMADLMRNIDLDCEVEFMEVSSYGNELQSTGVVKILKGAHFEVEGRHVLIIEDILDSGCTLSYLKEYFLAMNPASFSICSLLDKPARRQADIKADYLGFVCPDVFIVGYGLDFAGQYRNLPYVGSLRPEIYS